LVCDRLFVFVFLSSVWFSFSFSVLFCGSTMSFLSFTSDLVNSDQSLSFSAFTRVIAYYLIFFISYLPIAHFISLSISETYRKHSVHQKASWLSYCLSLIHSPISGVWAFSSFWNWESESFHFGANSSAVACILFTYTYMLVDLMIVILFFKGFHRHGPSLVIHHLVILITYSYGILQSPIFGVYTMVGFQLQELTNPFITIRFFMLELMLPKAAPIYQVNFAIGATIWIVTRIFIGTFVIFRYFYYLPSTLGTAWHTILAHILAAVFQFLQYYWTGSLLVKEIFKSKDPKKKSG